MVVTLPRTPLVVLAAAVIAASAAEAQAPGFPSYTEACFGVPCPTSPQALSRIVAHGGGAGGWAFDLYSEALGSTTAWFPGSPPPLRLGLPVRFTLPGVSDQLFEGMLQDAGRSAGIAAAGESRLPFHFLSGDGGRGTATLLVRAARPNGTPWPDPGASGVASTVAPEPAVLFLLLTGLLGLASVARLRERGRAAGPV